MDFFFTVDKEYSGEITEKRSRFIAVLHPVSSVDEAWEVINNIRKIHRDARHNVYAYSLRDGTFRFSDDGEPHGTAGKPLMDILNGENITDAVLVVTRYFGGVLLGPGGLMRAYSDAAKQAVDSAYKIKLTKCTEIEIECPYNERAKIVYFASGYNAIENGSEFAENVKMKFIITTDKTEDFVSAFNEAFAMKAKIITTKEDFFNIL